MCCSRVSSGRVNGSISGEEAVSREASTNCREESRQTRFVEVVGREPDVDHVKLLAASSEVVHVVRGDQFDALAQCF